MVGEPKQRGGEGQVSACSAKLTSPRPHQHTGPGDEASLWALDLSLED